MRYSLSLISIGILSVSCFNFPKIKFVGIPLSTNDANSPRIRVESGVEEAIILKRSVADHCKLNTDCDSSTMFCWEPHVQESYKVADSIFQQIAENARDSCNKHHASPTSTIIAFPSMERQTDLEKIAKVLQSDKCKQLLGLEDALAEIYPSSPAPYLRLTFSSILSKGADVIDNSSKMMLQTTSDSSIPATESWVDNFLGRYSLCPYTSSVTRAAVGLSSVGVPFGGIHVQHASTHVEGESPIESTHYNKLRASELASAFWSETVTLLHSNQDEWATSLVVFPEYDNEFESFVDVCDNIVEPIVVATQSTDFIGRAWFHPKYDADSVGHTSVIAGHAVPHRMVQDVMSTLYGQQQALDYDALVEANNRVRKTPHATINILRRSQLVAAGEYEKGLGEKRPKPNSIYVRNAVRLSKGVTSLSDNTR